jgi:hypothetical protein
MSITQQISNHTDKINIRIQLLTAAEYRNIQYAKPGEWTSDPGDGGPA